MDDTTQTLSGKVQNGCLYDFELSSPSLLKIEHVRHKYIQLLLPKITLTDAEIPVTKID